MNSIIFLVALWCCIGFLWYRYNHNREPPPSEPADILKLIEVSDRLHQLTEQYRQIDTMLTNINLIGGNAERGISLAIPDLTGKTAQYDFICAESDTDNFTAALTEEQNRLRAEIIKTAEMIGENLRQ